MNSTLDKNKWYKDRGKVLLVFGISFIVIAIGVAIGVIYNYMEWSKDIMQFGPRTSDTDIPKFQDLATVLSGTSGLFLTISGIIFLIYTVQQSKEEMIATNKTMNKQFAESTYFNLLKMHQEVLMDKDTNLKDFISEMRDIKLKTDKYYYGVKLLTFQSFIETYYRPGMLYAINEKTNAAAKSLINIANQIKQKLNDDQFYHNTFFINLSPDEKFLIGMVIKHKLEGEIEDYSYPYTNVYESAQPNFNSKFGHISPISLRSFCDESLVLPELNYGPNLKHVLDKLTKFDFDSGKHWEFVSILCNCKAFLGKKEEAQKLIILSFQDKNYNLTLLYKDFILAQLKKALRVEMDFTFNFNYKGELVVFNPEKITITHKERKNHLIEFKNPMPTSL